MNSLTKVAPIKPFVTDEGIELYATDSECGMSLRGLARFCGVNLDSVSKLIQRMGDHQNNLKSLQSLSGKGLWVTTTTFENNAKVIKSEACAAICSYYAIESKAANDTARFSLAKFATMGIDSWIRKTTGHEQPAFLTLTTEQMAMQLLQVTQAAMETQTKLLVTTEKLLEKEQYISKATIDAPGLQQFLDSAQGEDDLLLANDEQHYTLAEWLALKETTIPDRMMRQFRLRVAEFFKTLHHYKPKQGLRYNSSGNGMYPNVYGPEDFHFLDTVYTQVHAAYRP